MNKRTIFVVVSCLGFLMGCVDEKAQVRFAAHKDYESNRVPEIHVTVYDGIRATDVVLNERTPTVGPCTTAKHGTLRIACVVLLDGEPTQTGGSIELPLKSDWRWGVDFFIQDENPANTCFGCFGSDSFELDPSLGYDEGKRLYIVWGGNSISNPVVY